MPKKLTQRQRNCSKWLPPPRLGEQKGGGCLGLQGAGAGTTSSGTEPLGSGNSPSHRPPGQGKTGGREREAGTTAFHLSPCDLLPVSSCFSWTVGGGGVPWAVVEPLFFPGESFPFPLPATDYPWPSICRVGPPPEPVFLLTYMWFGPIAPESQSLLPIWWLPVT